MQPSDLRSPAARRFARLVADVYELGGELERCGEVVARGAGQTGARWKVLSAASTGGQTVAQLARRLGLSRQNVQRLADVLEKDGLVVFRPNPDHQRSPYAELAPAGQRALARLSAAASKWEDPLAARLDNAAVDEAQEFVRKLLRLLRQHPPTGRRKE